MDFYGDEHDDDMFPRCMVGKHTFTQEHPCAVQLLKHVLKDVEPTAKVLEVHPDDLILIEDTAEGRLVKGGAHARSAEIVVDAARYHYVEDAEVEFNDELCHAGAVDVNLGEWLYGQLEKSQVEAIHGKPKKIRKKGYFLSSYVRSFNDLVAELESLHREGGSNYRVCCQEFNEDVLARHGKEWPASFSAIPDCGLISMKPGELIEVADDHSDWLHCKKVNDDKVRGYHPTVYSMRIPEYITMLFAWQTQRVSAARDKAQSKAGIVGHAVKIAAESSEANTANINNTAASESGKSYHDYDSGSAPGLGGAKADSAPSDAM